MICSNACFDCNLDASPSNIIESLANYLLFAPLRCLQFNRLLIPLFQYATLSLYCCAPLQGGYRAFKIKTQTDSELPKPFYLGIDEYVVDYLYFH